MSTPDPGLCAGCTYKKLVISDRGSHFLRCTNSELAKYPRLPVLACLGYAGEKGTENYDQDFSRRTSGP